MIFQKFSKRQKLTLTWWKDSRFKDKDGIIDDGSIRSGKTVSMAIGFILWSMYSFDGQYFGISGRTIESLRRNVIVHLFTWLSGIVDIKERRSENKLIIRCGNRVNTYYLFGGRDESSYTLVQGVTLAGAYFDEVALMPRSFVEQAMARCSVPGSKFWFNCNPESPNHWFYQEIIKKADYHNYLYLHFTMEDNLSLSPAIRARYDRMYSGVFYDRYIRGLWVVAEGLIYTMFNKDFHVVPTVPRPYEQYYVSCDYGTLNPTAAGLYGLYNGIWYKVEEYYFDARKEGRQKTDEEHYKSIDEMILDRNIRAIIVDPSAASFIEVIRRHGKYNVIQASNSVLSGIRLVATHLNLGDLKFNDCCEDTIREFGLYRWDEKASEDKPLKTNDHSMDETRYFCRQAFGVQRISF